MSFKHCQLIQKEADINQRIPLSLRLHILRCQACRMDYRRLKNVQKHTLGTSLLSAPQSTDDIMKNIPLRDYSVAPRQISDIVWLLTGLPLFVGGIVLPNSGAFLWAQLMFGSHYQIITFMIFGILITAYSILFVISHYHFFSQHFHPDIGEQGSSHQHT